MKARTRVNKVYRETRRFGRAHGYHPDDLLKMNKNSPGRRKVLATKIKWARSYYTGKGTKALKSAVGL